MTEWRLYYIQRKQVPIMKKTLSTILFTLLASVSLSGCNTLKTNDIALACEDGIERLNNRLESQSFKVNQVHISRANSLLLAAQVQHQFAEFSGCLGKLKRADDYLNGQQKAIISRLSI